MNHLAAQRALILAFVSLLTLDVTFELSGIYAMSGPLKTASDSLRAGPTGLADWILGGALVVNFAALIGAWWNQRWARWAIVLCTVPFVLYLTPEVQHPLEAMMDYLSSLVEGALMALLWLPTKVVERRVLEPSLFGVGGADARSSLGGV